MRNLEGKTQRKPLFSNKPSLNPSISRVTVGIAKIRRRIPTQRPKIPLGSQFHVISSNIVEDNGPFYFKPFLDPLLHWVTVD